MKLNWKKTIGYGVIIWVVAFVVASLIMALGILNTYVQWLIIQIAVVIAGYKFVRKLNLVTNTSAIITGLVWVAVVIVLDLIITRYFTTMSFFRDWKTWVSYLIILFLPIVTIAKTAKKTETMLPPTSTPLAM